MQNHQNQRGSYIREFIFGFNDGLVSTLALVAGLTGAVLEREVIIIAGIASAIAGAISMALGAYISSKSQKEVYLREIEQEKRHIEKAPKTELKQLCLIYKRRGFTDREVEVICNGLKRNKKRWLQVMTQELLGFTEEFKDLKKITLIMGLSFIVGASIPLVPYLLFNITTALTFSIFLCIVALFLAGIAKTKFTGLSWIKSGIEMVVIGCVATLVSYYAGYLVGIII